MGGMMGGSMHLWKDKLMSACLDEWISLTEFFLYWLKFQQNLQASTERMGTSQPLTEEQQESRNKVN